MLNMTKGSVRACLGLFSHASMEIEREQERVPIRVRLPNLRDYLSPVQLNLVVFGSQNAYAIFSSSSLLGLHCLWLWMGCSPTRR